MIQFGEGDILDAACDALVCPVNCRPGVMGAGLALQFARRWPEVRRHHEDAVRSGLLVPGKVAVSYGSDRPAVILFPTKDHWRGHSHLDMIWDGLHDLTRLLTRRRSARNPQRTIDSIAVPALGCGLGGLDWGMVRPMIESAAYVVPSVAWTYFAPKAPPARTPAFDPPASGEPVMVRDRRGGMRQLGMYDG